MPKFTLVSHHLCPYVQRVAIALAERGVPFKRVYIDLANKPEWFKSISPLGKVPLLRVKNEGEPEVILFESTSILEFLEDTLETPLHPANLLERARHRGWIEFGSAILNGIGRFYNARTEIALEEEAAKISTMFAQIEGELGDGPYFTGQDFTLVDSVFGPVFRYFDTFDHIADFGVFKGMPKVAAWRAALARRPSVRGAVQPGYPEDLRTFLRNRHSAISDRIPELAA